jgi:hypothetical protein
MGSLDCLRPMGMAINYGGASGGGAALAPARVAGRHPPTLGTWIADRGDLERAADKFLNWSAAASHPGRGRPQPTSRTGARQGR